MDSRFTIYDLRVTVLAVNQSLGVPALAGPDRLKAGHPTGGMSHRGSWSQCMRKRETRLSMNLNVEQASRLPASAKPTHCSR